jgi:hypothetical protein
MDLYHNVVTITDRGHKKNPVQDWAHSEPMVGLEPTTSGLQIRFHSIAEYHSCSFCAHNKPLAFTEYHPIMHLFIAVDVTVDVKSVLKC